MDNMYINLYKKSPRYIQTFGINIFELRELMIRRSNKFVENLKLLKHSEIWSKEAIANYQNKHFRNIVQYAYKNVPFYHKYYNKNRIDISKINSVSDLEKLPIVHKEDIVINGKDMFSSRKEKFVLNHTSGTTGKPLGLRISHDLAILFKANAYRRDLWAGYRDEWIARFVGDKPIRNCEDKVLFRKSYINRRVIFPSYCLSTKTLPNIIDSLERNNTKFIQCYPSTGYILAKFLEYNDRVLPLKGVLYSSETLYDYQRSIIEDRFRTKVWGFYSQAEEVVSALECSNREYHLTAIDGITEITKNGEILSSGEKGFTVVTSLHNYAMPLIRYELNDYTGFKDDDCDCGRKSPLIYPIESRIDDFVLTPEGRIISPCLFDIHLRSMQNILEVQFLQENLNSITIRIVRQNEYEESDELRLLDSFKKLLGEEIDIKIEYVEKIYQTGAYKKRFVINKLGKSYIERFFELGC